MSAAFSIRPAVESDAEFVLELFASEHVRRFAHGPVNADDFIASLGRPGKENMIVERDGTPFGNLMLGTSLQWLLELQIVAVSENGRGAGRFAVDYAIRRAFEEVGAHRIYLEVLAANARARALYERAGFRAEGLMRDGYRAVDGTFHDLVPYGMLASDRAAK